MDLPDNYDNAAIRADVLIVCTGYAGQMPQSHIDAWERLKAASGIPPVQ